MVEGYTTKRHGVTQWLNSFTLFGSEPVPSTVYETFGANLCLDRLLFFLFFLSFLKSIPAFDGESIDKETTLRHNFRFVLLLSTSGVCLDAIRCTT